MSDFWTRRRESVAAEVEADTKHSETVAVAQRDAELEARDDGELLGELDLPQPEELTSAEEVQEFLRADLPQRLKTRALRRLWRLNPMLANLDGLIEYGEDFTDSATVMDSLQTTYQVGKGMLGHLQALAAEEDGPTEMESETVEPREDVNESDSEGVELIADESEDIGPAPIEFGESSVATVVEEDAIEIVPSRRRMQFEFGVPT